MLLLAVRQARLRLRGVVVVEVLGLDAVQRERAVAVEGSVRPVQLDRLRQLRHSALEVALRRA